MTADKDINEQAFVEAYEKHSDAIFRYCYYRVFDREKAKDVVQEAYCRTWKYLTQGHTVDNLKAFLYRTANNIIIDESRKKKAFSLNQIMEKGFTPSIDSRQKTEDMVMGREMMELVKSLGHHYSDVILMRYIEGLSVQEIALILHESENNIYVKIHRGLKKLREMNKKMEQDNHGK